MNYMVRRTRIARSAIFGRCTIFLITQIRIDSNPIYSGYIIIIYMHIMHTVLDLDPLNYTYYLLSG